MFVFFNIVTINSYPSGNIAVVGMLLYSSAVSYTLLEDKINGSVIGYFDELGRGWLNKEDGSIRLLIW